MPNTKLDTELFENKTEIMGVDSVDFVLENATYVRVQVLVKGMIKVLPNELIEELAEVIKNYDIMKHVEEKYVK